jgi:hypothetical protein
MNELTQRRKACKGRLPNALFLKGNKGGSGLAGVMKDLSRTEII